MKVLLLDPRWPTMVPVTIIRSLSGEVSYTEEVPISIRWELSDIASDNSSEDLTSERVLISTDAANEEVAQAVAQGAELLEVPSRKDAIGEAVQIMNRAVSLGEWEASQTHTSLLPYLDEEVGEFKEAVENGAPDDEVLAELGDVLLQILFHAEIASRRSAFSFPDVANSFVEKMRARAPYLFDGTTIMVPIEEQERLWKLGKSKSK